MWVSQASFENFRSFERLDLNLNQGFIVLCGPNGAGKTNFLEGIYVGSTLDRFPDSKLTQLFREGASFFRLFLITHAKEEQTQELFVQQAEGRFVTTTKISHQKISRKSYVGQLPIVTFLPQNLNLLTSSPNRRRHFFDETLSQVSPSYSYALGQYKKILKQRNELLSSEKDPQALFTELEAWNPGLAKYGSQITSSRRTLSEFIIAEIQERIVSLSPELKTLTFSYINSGGADESAFHQQLQESFTKEIILRTTIVGPHRDDFSVKIEEKEVAGFISRGQMRAVTLALKFVARDYIHQELQKVPLMLLDDVLSEFDEDHQKKMLDFLRNQEQVFITTSHWEETKKFLPSESQVFQVQKGRINPI